MSQRYYCENEECGCEISGEDKRTQCIGCGRWFCYYACTSAFVQQNDGRVCGTCYRTWLNLCAARGLSHMIGYEQQKGTIA